MTAQNDLSTAAPTALVGARNMAHRAAQLLSRTSAANLEPRPDYSHDNLGWDAKLAAFLTQPLPSEGGVCHVGLDIAGLALLIVRDGEPVARFDLDGKTDADAQAWLDGELAKAGLRPMSSAALVYDLPDAVTGIGTYARSHLNNELSTLAAWFAFADGLLTRFAGNNSGLHPGPSPVRCWPHHFDVATYVSLEEGDFETAKGIGVGLSPGDGSYAQPYFYVTPFPAPPLADLPDAPTPGHWHGEGFVGAIATGDEVLTLDDAQHGAAAFIDRAFAIGREKLGV